MRYTLRFLVISALVTPIMFAACSDDAVGPAVLPDAGQRAIPDAMPSSPDAVQFSCEDGTQNGDETGIDCGGSCEQCMASVPQSCADILAADANAADGEYELDRDGPGGDAPTIEYCDMTQFDGGWTRCLRFVNSDTEDLASNDWLDGCVDATMADWSGEEVLVTLKGPGGNQVYAATGTRPGGWSYDNVTSTAEPGDQDDLANHGAAVALSLDGVASDDVLVIPGRIGSDFGCAGAMGNGYAVLIYDDDAISQRSPKIMMLPYRLQVGDNRDNPRSFGSTAEPWTASHEISYNGTTNWDTCDTVPAFLGTLELYVR